MLKKTVAFHARGLGQWRAPFSIMNERKAVLLSLKSWACVTQSTLNNRWGHSFLFKLQLDTAQADHSVSEVSELVSELSSRHRGTVGDLSGADIQNFIEPNDGLINEPFEGELDMTRRIFARDDPNNTEGEEDDEVEITVKSVREHEISRVSRKECLAIISVISDCISQNSADVSKILGARRPTRSRKSQKVVSIASFYSVVEPRVGIYDNCV